MAADPGFNLQTAVYTVLHEDSGLISLIGDGASPERARVYDHVEDDVTFPYITIGGESDALPFDAKSVQGMETHIMVHVWSRYRGMKEVRQILAAVRTALDDVALSVAGASHIMTRLENQQTFLDPDGLTRHGVARYRIITQEA